MKLKIKCTNCFDTGYVFNGNDYVTCLKCNKEKNGNTKLDLHNTCNNRICNNDNCSCNT